jgi:hypothetical protein
VADKKDGGNPDKPLLKEEPILARLGSGSAPAPTGLTSYVGILGRSPREGYWLLYRTLDMSQCVEIREEDIVHSEVLSADKSPFGSLGGTRVYVKKGADVTTTRTVSRSHQAGDEFDLDVRLGAGGGPVAHAICDGTEDGTSCAAECGPPGTDDTCVSCATCAGSCGPTCDTCHTFCGTCPGDTCVKTCNTCQNTCNTCNTNCGTCQTCATCHTNCGTCQTCHTNCGTCQTCHTNCGTCKTCHTQCGTCPGDTCAACTHVTCFRTCSC